jgi:hypothetical protein
MAFYINSLEFRPLDDYNDFRPPPGPFKRVTMQTLLKVPPCDGQEGDFQISLASKEHVDVKIDVYTLFPSKTFAGMTIEGQLEIGVQVFLQPNSAASRWEDLMEMLAAQDLEVLDSNGDNAYDQFMTAFDELKKKGDNPSLGISWRWIVVAKLDSRRMELQVNNPSINKHIY